MPYPMRHHALTLDEYFAIERSSPRKHEYADGRIWVMAGGSWRHNYLSASALRALGVRLGGGPCFPMSPDQRISTPDGLYTYADGSVFCGVIEPGPEHTATNPVVVIEVLSDSTRAYDRGEKLDRYRTIPALRHVVLIEPDAVDVEVWSRGDEGWSRRVAVDREARIPLPALGIELGVAEIYDGVERVPAG